MVGTRECAALALDGKLEVLSFSGTTRAVYIADDVVYKVEFEAGTNVTEYNNVARIEPFLPDHVRIPATSLHTIGGIPVIAMEYIEGQLLAECYCWDDEVHDDTCMTGGEVREMSQYIGDTGGMNVIRDAGGTYWLIDLALSAF